MNLLGISGGRRARRGGDRAGGFTLPEMIVSSTILGILMLMMVRFQFETISAMTVSEEKGEINRDMRYLTDQMALDARQANFFVMYSNYTMASRTSSTQELTQGNSGDFLVLVFYGTTTSPSEFNVCPVNEIIGYYRAPYTAGQTDSMSADTQMMPVRKFDLTVANNGIPANTYLESVNVPSGGHTATLESLLPSDSPTTIGSHQIIVQLAQGLADQQLFYNFWGKSVMVNGVIAHGNNDQHATDTYNFTISPRG
jgi:prepilin-type N-terminal cleavage/methylation domain-containing protein